MSGFGGIAGVSTVFVIVSDSPGSIVSVTVAGITPGAAAAAPTTTVQKTAASARSAAAGAVLRFIGVSSPLCLVAFQRNARTPVGWSTVGDGPIPVRDSP
jgi:hypothetical protein